MRKIMIKLSRALLIGLILLACIPFTANAKVKLTPKNVTVEVGKTTTIKVKGAKKKIKWSSKNKRIASVSKKGVVKGINAGKTTITAKIGKKKYNCSVTVKKPATVKPSLAKTTINMLAGDISCIEVNNYSGRLKCESSNKEVAVVANNGTILGKSNGQCLITVNAGGTILKCTVNVSNPAPKAVPTPTLVEKTINMLAGEISCIEVNNYSGRLSCQSSNKEIAIVSNNGTIIAKDYGKCVITVNAGGTVLHCTVNVSIPSPKCYPNNGGMLSSNVRIDSFTLDFVAYEPHYSVEDPNNSVTYFYPYKYRLRIRGKASSAGEVGMRLTFSSPNGYESIPANNSCWFDTNEDGSFDIEQYVCFSQFGD